VDPRLLRIVVLVLLNRPIHGRVRDGERRDDVERLGLEAPPRIEDGGVEGAGEGRLAVRGYGVRGYAFLGLRAEVAPASEEFAMLRVQRLAAS